MASSGGISDDNFIQLLKDISEWYDQLGYINMLKVLYRDHVIDTNALYSASNVKDLMDKLHAFGNLSPTDLSILYDTINVTGQFGFKPKNENQLQSFQNVREIVISKFTWHRQKLLKLGMALTPDDVAKLDSAYNMPSKKYKDSWSLIMDLEQKMIICEEEETMKAFTDKLHELKIHSAVRALIVTEGVPMKLTVKRKRDSSDFKDQPNQKRPVQYPDESLYQMNPLDLAKALKKCKGNLPSSLQLKDMEEVLEICEDTVKYFKQILVICRGVDNGSIVFHLSVHDPSALVNLWEIHLSGELLRDIAEILVPEKHQQQEFLDEWMTCIDELEYKTALNKLKEKVPCDSKFCIVSDDTEWENQLMEDLKQRRPDINGIILKNWRLSKPETVHDLIGQSRKVIIAFSSLKTLTDYSKYAAHSIVLEILEAKTLVNANVIVVKLSEDTVLPPEFESFTVANAWEKHFVDQVLQNLDEYVLPIHGSVQTKYFIEAKKEGAVDMNLGKVMVMGREEARKSRLISSFVPGGKTDLYEALSKKDWSTEHLFANEHPELLSMQDEVCFIEAKKEGAVDMNLGMVMGREEARKQRLISSFVVGVKTDLHEAISNKDWSTVHLLTDEHPELLSVQDELGDTPLIQILKTEENIPTDIVADIANKTPTSAIDIKNKEGDTALMYACKNGHVECAKLLLEAGVDINARSYKRDDTALMCACKNGHVECAKLLLEANVDINAMSLYEGDTALMDACKNGHVECAKSLLEAGVDINAMSFRRGDTALMYACKNGHVECAKLLLEAGVDINTRSYYNEGDTALMYACKNGHVECAKLLLEAGVDINARSYYDEGDTALMYACKNGHVECAKLLLEPGVDINARSYYDRGDAALMYACKNGHVECAKLLLEAGVDINTRSYYNRGNTALMCACRNGHVECAKLLLEANVDINAMSLYEGDTALMYACKNGHVECAKLLLEANADINARSSEGNTAVMCACKNGHVECAKLLLETGVDINARSYNNGDTALHIAAYFGDASVVKLLLDAGASFLQSKNGNTPLHACFWNQDLHYDQHRKVTVAFMMTNRSIASIKNKDGKTAIDLYEGHDCKKYDTERRSVQKEELLQILKGGPLPAIDFTPSGSSESGSKVPTNAEDFPAMLVRVSENIGEDLTMWKVALSDHIKNADAIQKATRAIQLFEELIKSTDLKAEDIRILLETINLTGVLRLQEYIPNCPRLDNIEITRFTKFRQSVMAFGKELTDDDIGSIALCYQLQRRYDDKWSLIMDLERKLILVDDEKFDDFKSNLDQIGLRRLSRYLER